MSGLELELDTEGGRIHYAKPEYGGLLVPLNTDAGKVGYQVDVIGDGI